jgi:DNA-binding Lrp family transcriptional regulator
MSENTNIHFVQFENRKLPKFLEVKDADWITYGEDNDYPYYLENLYQRSSYHSAIINAKIKYIVGGGWTYDKTGIVSLEQKALAEKMINQPFADVDLNETTFRCATDLEKYNGFAILVKWNKSRKGAVLEYIDFGNLRTNADRSEFYYTQKWYVTDTRGLRKKNKKPQEEKDWKVYKPYDAKDRSGDQIYYWSAYAANQYAYPLPMYVGAVTWIENHVKYTDFQYKNISASFSPAKIINIYGQTPEPEQQKVIVDGMKRNFTGEEGERIVVAFAPNKDLGTEAVDSVVQDQSVLYKEIADQCLHNIFTAHEFPKLLLGYSTEGALGQRNELETYYQMFQNTYAEFRQTILERVFNMFASDFGIGLNLALKKLNPLGMDVKLSDEATKMLNAFNSLPQALQTKAAESLTAEEIRAMVGAKGIKTTTTQTTATQFSAVKLDLFAQFGVDASKYVILDERDIPTHDGIKLAEFEHQFLTAEAQNPVSKFATDVKIKSVDRSVLDLLTKDPFMPVEEMAKAIKVPPYQVRDAVKRLLDRDLITPSKESIAGEPVKSYEVAKDAADILDAQPAKTSDYKVMYKYDLETNAPALVAGGQSRKFCADLMALGKLYSREDINAMSAREDRNVWSLRGGWYHNRNTGINRPQCRHTWKQVIVREK